MVYEIVKFDMIGRVLYTYQERPDIVIVTNHGKIEFVNENGTKEPVCRLYTLCTDLNEYKGKEIYPHTQALLPYFADVTEDRVIPKILRDKGMEPETYKNCQLLSEKHGAYLQFIDHATNEVHRIAMNSNYYTPIK